jgi:tyrosyl-tRNA synthetase
MIATNDTITEILTRGVEEVIDRAHLEAKLRGKKKLVIKLGIDPTSQNIHIGRATALWKLRALQDLGHKIVFIIGDFTGLIGDTSDKDAERPMLTKAQIKENLKGYIQQVGMILDLKKTETHFNSEWLADLGYLEIAEQADQFSLHEFTARENIALRVKAQKRVSVREVLYPLMQGYDSVAIKCDVEVGGSDQRFNLLAGRTLQKHYRQEPQDIMTFTLLEGTDGRKMSSSWGNVINLTDTPKDMFGKTMSILDALIVKYLKLCTHLPLTRIEEMAEEMASGKLNPRDAKALLAHELVEMYHGRIAADRAQEAFFSTFSKGEVPADALELKMVGDTVMAVVLKVEPGLSATKAKAMVDQGGVKVNGEPVAAKDYSRKVSAGDNVQVGKRKFAKVAR